MRSFKSNKILIIRSLGLLTLILASLRAYPQFFDGGQNPPSVKFDQINTPRFQIIYPTLFKNEAERMANTLEAIITDVSMSLGHQPKPISIILQTQGVSSNGFVQMAPRKSEFYTIPAQEFDSQDWLNSLAVHELRHVVQFDKLAPNLSAPLFEELKLALFGLNLPAWYFEGDAVGIETALTNAGRGRQPSFEMVLRANEISGNHFSYSKNYFGSLKDYTPGYYPLGYFMTTKMRKDFGPNILDQILERIKNLPIRPYAFSSSLKKFGGINTNQHFHDTMNEMDSLWTHQLSKVDVINYPSINPDDDKIPTGYLLPYATEDGTIICLKGSKAEVPSITLIKNKKEKRLIKIGYQTEPNLNYANHKVVWDEYRSDIRFNQRSFNVICIFDLQKKKYKQLTHKTRLFSPALSADGKKIIAVKVSTENIFNLVELNAQNGEEIKSYPNPLNFTLQTPTFNEDGTEVVVTAVNEQGKTIWIYKSDGSHNQLLPQEYQIISRPIFYKNQIIYKAHYNGLDNIYSYDRSSQTIQQISRAKFGAFNPSINKKENHILFNDYQPNGYNISSIDLSDSESINQNKHINTFVKYFKPLITQENKLNVFDSIPNKKYESKPYHDFSHILYFHSIRPINQSNPYLNSNDFGFDLVSNNKLNTLTATVGYLYNNGLNKHQYNAYLLYSKYYPQISFNFENRARLAYDKQQNGDLVPFEWRENISTFKINLPINTNWLNKSFYAAGLLETYYTSRYQFISKPSDFRTTINFPMKYTLREGMNTIRSARDLAPKWGQNMSITYQHAPFVNNLDGYNLYFKSRFYAPGLVNNHSFQVSYNWQSSNGGFAGSDDIPRASGFADLKPIFQLSNTVLLNYDFPLFYPDWEIGPLAYIKRFKAGLFSDFENIGKGNGLRSYGFNITADMNLLRYYLPNFSVGSKIIIPHESVSKKPIFELLFTYSY